nr:uncharacterized protein LOC113716180 [Coffea arabica]
MEWGRLSEVKGKGELGFRDLQQFNTAMLAKQFWRILIRPNLLVSKIVTGRYFKGSSIRNMKIHAGDSWIWKSILSSREVLTEGRVHELISDGRWNEGLLKNMFEEEGCQRILNSQISAFGDKDRLVWMLSKSGGYTVKSRYVVAKEMQLKGRRESLQQESSSRNEANSGVWKFLWSLNVKHKLKHFIWKCLQCILPVNETIRRRIRQGNDGCRCCGKGTETMEHMFFFCKHAELIWKAAPISWNGLKDYRHNFWQWWSGLMEAKIEKSRNQIQFNREERCPGVTTNKVVQEWLEFQEANIAKRDEEATGKGKEDKMVRWEPPSENFLCLNTDAAIKQNEAKVG